MSSYVVKKERCPACAKQGKDNSEDNLAVYSDNRKFCFSCHYTEFPNKITSFKSRIAEDNSIDYELPYLPVDCDILYPQRALDWVEQYELTKEDLYKHNVLWSESLQRLIFPVFADGGLLAWQGRSFYLDVESQKKYPKWFGRGNLKQTNNFLGTGKVLVVCEDILSSIKIAKAGYRSLPLYGSSVGRARFQTINNNTNENDIVVIWLDRDKWKESLAEVRLGTLCGLNCNSISTELDPKLVNINKIKELLTIL